MAERGAVSPDGAATRPVAVSLRGLTKVFGPSPARALEALRAGADRKMLRERHGHVLALHDVHLDVPAGRIQVVMGLSGSGKSTLIRHVNRLVEPTAGEVWVHVDGRPAEVLRLDADALRRFRRTHTAMVLQGFGLFPHLTVEENVAYGLQVRGLPVAARTATARRWIERVGLAGQEHRYPATLSGGMRQRVGLARALATDAPLLLMDEPFSALDPLIRRDLQTMLLALQRELGKTIVLVTHDLDEALRLGDRIAILRDGRVVQQGSGPQIVLQPADDHVAHFVRDVNRGRVLRCRTLMHDGPPVDGPAVDAELVIEEAARRLGAEHRDAANVVDANGRPLGVVTLRDIVGAIVPPAAT